MKGRFLTIVFVIIIPFLAIIAAFPLYNRVEPFILGFPFFYFWFWAWFVLTTVSMYIGWRLDPAVKQQAEQEDGGPEAEGYK